MQMLAHTQRQVVIVPPASQVQRPLLALLLSHLWYDLTKLADRPLHHSCMEADFVIVK